MRLVWQQGDRATVENMCSYAQRTTRAQGHDHNPGGAEVLNLREECGLPLIPFFSLVHALPRQLNKIS